MYQTDRQTRLGFRMRGPRPTSRSIGFPACQKSLVRLIDIFFRRQRLYHAAIRGTAAVIENSYCSGWASSVIS